MPSGSRQAIAPAWTIREAPLSRAHDAVEVAPDGRAVLELELLGDDGPSEADSGEASVLGEGVDLDAAGARALDLEDGLGHVVRLDKGRVRRVVHHDRALLVGPVDQLLALRLGGGGAGG